MSEKDPSPADSGRKLIVHDGDDVDEALKFLRDEGGDVPPLTPQREAKLVRRIDFMIMPLMWCCYTLQYLDKTLINYAAVMGLLKEAHVTKGEFSTLALIFYVTYLGFEYPHGYAIQRLPKAKYLGAMVTFWGIIVATTSACTNYAGLVTTRVLLGCFEAAIAPSLVLITSMWYQRQEQPPRIGIWYTGQGMGVIFGSIISFALQHYRGKTFYSWQIMFLVVGLITGVVGLLVIWLLPDNPMKSRLSREETVWAVERLRANQTGVENTQFKAKQVLECFLDPQTYLLSLICIASATPNGAISSYQATIIKQFGFSSEVTALLQIPSGVISVIATLIATWIAGKYDMRGWQIVALLVPGILGGSLMAFLPDSEKAGKLIGNYLTNAIGASLPLLYSWVSANYAGHTKKVTMNATLLASFCIGNIIGPLTFTAKSAPNYLPAKITIVVVCAAALIFAVLLVCYYMWENKRRDRLAREGQITHVDNIEFLDVTDRKNLEFRYRY